MQSLPDMARAVDAIRQLRVPAARLKHLRHHPRKQRQANVPGQRKPETDVSG